MRVAQTLPCVWLLLTCLYAGTSLGSSLFDRHGGHIVHHRPTRRHGPHHVRNATASDELGVSDLPPTKQTRNRVLATITTASRIRESTLTRQLDAYVAMCEAGYEVHVVLVTYVSWLNNTAGVYDKSRYLCARLSSDLPVVTWVDDDVASVHLASQHRKVFAQLQDRYDYFISQEDDMLLQLKHMLYFQKWITVFAGTNLYPGFAVMEVPTSLHSVDDLYHYAPMTWNPFVGGYVRQLHVVRLGGTLAVMHTKAWVPLYILTRPMLQAAMARPAWHLDEHKPWKEYNTHFQHLWLTRYYRVVVPVEDMMTSFIHHTPNRYVNLDTDKNHPDDNMMETAAFAQLIDACLSTVNTENPATDVNLLQSMLHSCTECLSANATAQLKIKFPGTPPTGPTKHHSPPEISVDCVALEYVPYQETSVCRDDFEKLVCEEGT